MRYVLTFIAGLLLGGAVAATGLYFNPLTGESTRESNVGDWVLGYGSPISEALAFTHGRDSRLPSRPAMVPELWENTINRSLLSVMELSDAQGVPVGLASRISVPSEATELLSSGVMLTDQWLVTIPGQGSLFIHADSNLWPFFKENLIPVWYVGRPWAGPKTYALTAGPEPGGVARVVGASGRFTGVQGSAVERYRLEEFTPGAGPERFRAELALTLPPAREPAPAEEPGA